MINSGGIELNLVTYLKENGLSHSLKILWRYKIDLLLQKILLVGLKKKPLQNIIMIESHNDFDCNGGAFYNYIIKKNYNSRYRIVWAVKNKSSMKKKLPQNVCTVPLYRPSIIKNYYHCNAKYLLADCDNFKKVRSAQVSVYCSHGGVTFKNVKGLIVVPDETDYILCSSEKYAPLMCDNFSIKYPSERIINIGFPSNDILLDASDGDLFKLTTQRFEKVILWMPTFRKSKNGRADGDYINPFGLPLFETEEELTHVNSLLNNSNALLIIKYHPMQDMSLVKIPKQLDNIVFLDAVETKRLGIDVYSLMKDCDALISDYSSSAYSYILLNRPIGFILSDIANYKLGFSITNFEEVLSGHIINNLLDFITFIEDVLNDRDPYKEKREKLLHWLYKDIDSGCCERLCKTLKL